jgi:nucleotide sugar dehydrogenase
VVGLGYVGATLAVTLAARGRRVVGVERDRAIRDQLGGMRSHVHEAGLELIEAVQSGMLTVTGEVPDAPRIDTYVICVGTPVDDAGAPDLSQVESAMRLLAPHLRDGDLVVLRSTVPVGASRRLMAELPPGKDVELAFCPERTAQGVAVHELRTLPQIVAGSTPHAVRRAGDLFRILTPDIVEVSSFETAEIAKLACNSFRYTVFAFANELARLCEHVGVSANEARHAAMSGYARGAIPRPGPVGGPCLPKDTLILAGAFPERSGLVDSVSRVHLGTPDRVAEQVLAHVGGFRPLEVALLGVAFKGSPETDDERSSPAVDILDRLRRRHGGPLKIRSHDPLVPENRQLALGYLPCAEVKEAVDGANLVIIGTDHQQYIDLSLVRLTSHMSRPCVVYDAWASHLDEAAELGDGAAYLAFGEGQLM